MKELNTSLLRERFILHDPLADLEPEKSLIVAASNRMVLELANETLIVRTQNMHSCVRLAARILEAHKQGGLLLERKDPMGWEDIWNAATNDYERKFNPLLWASIYHQGKILFAAGEHHPLLDVIEKCDSRHEGDYESSIVIAEDAFKKTGKVVKIEYDGNVALAVHLESKNGRCGVILRGAHRTNIFNFLINAKEGKILNFAQCLSSSAAFLEGIQLAFMVGMNEEKIRLGMIERGSKDEKKTIEARDRLDRLSAEITNFEAVNDVRYRPEKPEFQHILVDAEKIAKETLKA